MLETSRPCFGTLDPSSLIITEPSLELSGSQPQFCPQGHLAKSADPLIGISAGGVGSCYWYLVGSAQGVGK